MDPLELLGSDASKHLAAGDDQDAGKVESAKAGDADERCRDPDPIIQFPTSTQSLNPYSYIMNNPFAGTDPSGYTISALERRFAKQRAASGAQVGCAGNPLCQANSGAAFLAGPRANLGLVSGGAPPGYSPGNGAELARLVKRALALADKIGTAEVKPLVNLGSAEVGGNEKESNLENSELKRSFWQWLTYPNELNSHVIIGAFNDSYRDSKADDPEKRHEEGGYWGFEKNGSYGVRRWPAGGSDSIAHPDLESGYQFHRLQVQGDWHIHPFPRPVDEWGLGVIQHHLMDIYLLRGTKNFKEEVISLIIKELFLLIGLVRIKIMEFIVMYSEITNEKLFARRCHIYGPRLYSIMGLVRFRFNCCKQRRKARSYCARNRVRFHAKGQA